MSYTMHDFLRDYIKEHFPQLTPQEQLEVLKSLPPEQRLAGLPPEQRLAGLSAEQIRQYLEQLTAQRPAKPPKLRFDTPGFSAAPGLAKSRSKLGKREAGIPVVGNGLQPKYIPTAYYGGPGGYVGQRR